MAESFQEILMRKKYSVTGTLKVPKVEETPNAFVIQNKKNTVEPVKYFMFVALQENFI